jgi:PPOX class probable F420-dependent enzyme
MPIEFDAETRKFLEPPNVAILATVSPEGRPQATPVWFVLEGNRVLVNTSKGRVKLRNLERNRRAALTVVDPQNMYRYVQIQGTVVSFDRANGAAGIERLSQRYLGRPYSYPSTDKPENRITILIEPLAVSGMGRR